MVGDCRTDKPSCCWDCGLVMAMFIMGFMMMMVVMVGLAVVLVMNISHIATIAMMICMIVHSLNPPVRQMNLVNALGNFPIRVLLMSKVRTIVLVMNVVFEMVGLSVVMVVPVMVIMMVVIIMMVMVRDCHNCCHTDKRCQDN